MNKKFLTLSLFTLFALITFTNAQEPLISFKKAPLATQYKKFDHERTEHKQKCIFCHARKEGDKKREQNLPYHNACIDCHATDFVSKGSALCQGCHETPLKEQVKAIRFPTQLRQYGLGSFSHRDHMDPSKMKDEKMPQCPSCHVFDSQNVFASFPAHPECFTCHVHQGGGKFGRCEVCHSPLTNSVKYVKSALEATDLLKFRHDKHFVQRSIGMDCKRCHGFLQIPDKTSSSDIFRINAAFDRKLHNSLCWSSGCHNTKQNPKDTQCSRCHLKTPPLSNLISS